MYELFAVERVKIIKDYLQKDKKVSVTKLSSLLNVTEVTIRRDLIKLEQDGFLQRTHGGAVLVEDTKETIPFQTQDKYTIQRTEIADTVLHLVSDDETIMITDGPTNLEIAKALATRNNLTVLTNDLKIALAFSNSPSNNLIMLGGDLDGNALYGQLSIDNMRNFSFDHVIFEADGIDKNAGITVSSINKASLIKQACSTAQHISVICLANHFGERSFYRVSEVGIADKIITNSSLEDEYKDYLFDLSIPLYTSVDIYEE